MADDKKNRAGDDESGLGNLPPLSDFDSGSGLDPDADLPPLGSFETRDTGMVGLPPLGDIGVETPNPAGGNIRPAPPGFEAASSGAIPSFGGRGTGFQDLAADSDFSPETPDIGPGPDTSLDTPIFDSAFGPSDSTFTFTPTTPTPAPTQMAIETPVFGEADFGGGQAIGGSFAPPAGGPGSTPIPDFGPDTGFGGADAGFGMPPLGGPSGGFSGPSGGLSGRSGTMGQVSTSGKSVKIPTAKKGGVNPIVAVVVLAVVAILAIYASPVINEQYKLPFYSDPSAPKLADKDVEVGKLKEQIAKLQRLPQADKGGAEISPEKVQELISEIASKTQQLEQVRGQLESSTATLSEKTGQLNDVERKIAEKNDEFSNAQAAYDDLRNETAIIQARQRGLVAEVDRLTTYVGELEEANKQRLATKESLESSVDRLLIQVKESIPLTPQKYDHAERLAAVQALRDKTAQVGWVTPEVEQSYTSMYLRELEIARSNEYFFAKVSVTDELGSKVTKWAECLMRGNWGVYYRTLDGKNIGVFENLGTSDTPKWGYRENLPVEAVKAVEQTVIISRVSDYQDKVQKLAEREIASKNGTNWQRNFNSL